MSPIKVMHAHLSEDPNFITRFRREAKSVAELHHPNIVQVFDFDVQGDVYYMVMEYIEGGETLKLRLQKLAEQGKRLSVEQTLDLVIKLADALAYAHDQGMIHRDIKPANVLLPSLDRPVLSDFGIARLLGATGLTTSGAMIGTPAYMSPEQGRGEHGDARSDIYSLGIVLYEMLTGQPPYDADTPFAIILKHINDPLIPPHVLIAPMPEAVERIVLKCLAKDADDRFASMAELRDALRGAQSELERQKTISTLEARRARAGARSSLNLQAAKPRPIQPATATPRSGGIKPAWLIGGAAAVVVIGVIIALALISRGGAPQSVARGSAGAPQPRSRSIARRGITAPASGASPGVARSGLPADCSPAISTGARDSARKRSRSSRIMPRRWWPAPSSRSMIGNNMKQAAADIQAAAPTMQDDPFFHLASGLLHYRSDEHLDPPLAERDFCTGD